MPVSKKRKKEGGKRRDHSGAPKATPPAQPEGPGGGGFLTRMRGGFQSMAGAPGARKESLLSKIVTWAILIVALYFVARRFGILP